jgi:hypothetical protein
MRKPGFHFFRSRTGIHHSWNFIPANRIIEVYMQFWSVRATSWAFPGQFFFQTQIKSGKLELINWRPVFCYNQQLLDVWCAGSTSGDGFDSSTRPTRLDPRRLEMWGKDRDRFSRATPTGKNRFLTYLQCWLMDTWINLISRLTRAQICIKIYIYRHMYYINIGIY